MFNDFERERERKRKREASHSVVVLDGSSNETTLLSPSCPRTVGPTWRNVGLSFSNLAETCAGSPILCPS